jgi:hypothetical protein
VHLWGTSFSARVNFEAVCEAWRVEAAPSTDRQSLLSQRSKPSALNAVRADWGEPPENCIYNWKAEGRTLRSDYAGRLSPIY